MSRYTKKMASALHLALMCGVVIAACGAVYAVGSRQFFDQWIPLTIVFACYVIELWNIGHWADKGWPPRLELVVARLGMLIGFSGCIMMFPSSYGAWIVGNRSTLGGILYAAPWDRSPEFVPYMQCHTVETQATSADGKRVRYATIVTLTLTPGNLLDFYEIRGKVNQCIDKTVRTVVSDTLQQTKANQLNQLRYRSFTVAAPTPTPELSFDWEATVTYDLYEIQ